MKIGIIREGKLPADKRVALSPEQCKKVIQNFPGTEIYIQSSPHRCIPDEEYAKAGLTVVDSIEHCDVLLGIKEVPVGELIANKTYLFFSHTIKKQPHNRGLLRTILEKNITLVDYETLTWDNGSRILGFGRFAGIVGAHNGLLTWGRKFDIYHIKPAHQCANYREMLEQYKQITLPAIKICLTGDGRVSHGVLELFNQLNIREVTPRAFLSETFEEAVFTQLRSEHYYEHKNHRPWDKSDFYHNPEDYSSVFYPYTHVTDLLVNGIFWHAGVPMFFTKEEMKSDDFKIRVIADISCDIPGSIPATIKATTIEDPVYGYHPLSEMETTPYQSHTIDVMAVGNLPCEMPYDASIGFGEDLIRSVIPHLIMPSKDEVITRATIATQGKLTAKFEYLKDYIE
ncbi:MAG: alanine dehydrogenase [Bacteroidetes bacterium]|nr:alanine dehydrogenase [Bacteroidota bacterium]